MDGLKAMLKAKRKETQQQFGSKKYVRRADLEAQRLKRLHEEEEKLAEKVRRQMD